MDHRKRITLSIVVACILAACGQEQAAQGTSATTASAKAPSSLRLYVFDCGTMQADVTRFRLEAVQINETATSAPVH